MLSVLFIVLVLGLVFVAVVIGIVSLAVSKSDGKWVVAFVTVLGVGFVVLFLLAGMFSLASVRSVQIPPRPVEIDQRLMGSAIDMPTAISPITPSLPTGEANPLLTPSLEPLTSQAFASATPSPNLPSPNPPPNPSAPNPSPEGSAQETLLPMGLLTNELAGAPSAMLSWPNTDEELFSATLFPSLQSAIGPLIRETTSRLLANESVSSTDDAAAEAKRIVHVVAKDSNGEAIQDRVLEEVKKDFPDWDVRISEEVTPGTLTLEVGVKVSLVVSAEWDHRVMLSRGSVRCTARTADDNAFTIVKTYDEKPWVHSFDRMVSGYPKRRFVVGYSVGFYSSESEARTSAMSDASEKLNSQFGPGKGEFLAQRAKVMDRFAQKLVRPYGEVWRQAVLLEFTESDVRELQWVRTAAAPAANEPSFLWIVGSLGMIASIAVVLCSLLNWVTEGYYRGRTLAFGMLAMLICSTLWILKS